MGTHCVTKEYLEQKGKGRMYRTGGQPETCHHFMISRKSQPGPQKYFKQQQMLSLMWFQ